MHRAWLVDDVVQHILVSVYEWDDETNRLASLLSIALTSKLFCSSALDHLWRRVEGLYTIEWVLRLQFVEANRYLQYLDRIRELELSEDYDALDEIAELPAFSSLRRLKLFARTPKGFQSIWPLMRDSLLDFHLQVGDYEFYCTKPESCAAVSSTITRLAYSAPHLEALSVAVDFDFATYFEVHNELLSQISRLDCLRTLTLVGDFSSSPQSLLIISQLLRLISLSVQPIYQGPVAYVTVQYGFSSLAVLCLHGNARVVCQVLQSMPKCSLHSLTLNFVNASDVDICEDTVSTFLSRSGQSLRRLYLDIGTFTGNRSPDSRVYCPLASILGFLPSHLEDVEFGLMDPLHMTNAFCFQVAQALPCLRHLKFRSEDILYNPPPGFVTLDALVTFARFCCQLQSLTIQLSPVWSDPIEEMLGNIPRCHLTHLNLDRSIITSPEQVCAFLHRVFPDVRDLDFNENHAGWDPKHQHLIPQWEECKRIFASSSTP